MWIICVVFIDHQFNKITVVTAEPVNLYIKQVKSAAIYYQR